MDVRFPPGLDAFTLKLSMSSLECSFLQGLLLLKHSLSEVW